MTGLYHATLSAALATSSRQLRDCRLDHRTLARSEPSVFPAVDDGSALASDGHSPKNGSAYRRSASAGQFISATSAEELQLELRQVPGRGCTTRTIDFPSAPVESTLWSCVLLCECLSLTSWPPLLFALVRHRTDHSAVCARRRPSPPERKWFALSRLPESSLPRADPRKILNVQ